MRISVEKESFIVKAEIDVSIDDLLAELEERVRRADIDESNEKLIGDPDRLTRCYLHHWGPIIDATTKMLARVPDRATHAFAEAAARMVIDRLRTELKRWELARYEAGRRARPDEVRQLADMLKECGLGSADRLAWQLVRADAAADSIEAVIRFWRQFANERSVGALHRRLSFVTREKTPEQDYFEAVGKPNERQAFNAAVNRWPPGAINGRPAVTRSTVDSE